MEAFHLRHSVQQAKPQKQYTFVIKDSLKLLSWFSWVSIENQSWLLKQGELTPEKPLLTLITGMELAVFLSGNW